MSQISIFDGAEPLRIRKPIMLVELFAGYGSQALALKYLGVPFQRLMISEWAIPSILAYKDLHCPDDNTVLSSESRYDDVVRVLAGGISRDYKTPLTEEQLQRMPKKKVWDVANAAYATRNALSICDMVTLNPVFAKWHERTYVMTYSFPCQSLSLAGKMDGMEEGSGTQSSLLWEVGRLLQNAKEHDVLPDILLMENVPEVIGERNIGVFRKWLELLHSLGYRSKWQILNAKDYKVPQNRRRCFMVSWRSDDYYDFPDPMPLEHRLKDLLEKDVSEKYYLTDKQIRYVKSPKRFGKHTRITDGDCIAMTRTATANKNWVGDFISCHQAGTIHGGMYEKTIEQSKRVWNADGLSPTVHTQSSEGSGIKIECQERVRCLTELECFRLQGVKREDFERLKVRQSSSSLYHMAGDSIETTCLMAIFGKMFEGLDYEKKIDEVVEDITHD